MKKKELVNQLEIEREKRSLLIKALADTLFESATLKEEVLLPKAEEVIFNGPATIVKWDDGSKTVSKARGGDVFDPLFGLIACSVRKVTNNHRRMVDATEDQIRVIAECVESFDDLCGYREFFAIMSDALDVTIAAKDKWYSQLGPKEPETEPEEEPKESTTIDTATTIGTVNVLVRDGYNDLNERIEFLEREHERTRQQVRNLMDAGEL